MKKFVKDYFFLIYFFVFLLIVLASLLNLSYIDSTVKNISILLFYFFSILGFFSFAKTQHHKTSIVLVILLPLVALFYMGNPVLLISFILFIYVVYRNKSLRMKWMISSAYLTMALILFVGIMLSRQFGDFSKTSIVSEVPSPSGVHKVILYENDQGALGGSTVVYVQFEFGGVLQWKNIIYTGRWGRRPLIEWVDDQNLQINNKEISVFTLRPIIDL